MNATTERFLKVLDDLVEKGKVKSIRQICLAIGLKPSQVTEARNGKREFPIKYADDLQSVYNVNKLYVLEDSGDMYLPTKNEKPNTFVNAKDIGEISYPFDSTETPFIDLGEGQILMIVPLVNERGRAGYLEGYADPEYVEELPKHTLTVRKEHRGTYRAFEVLGESMTDGTDQSINDGSIVTGRYLMHHHWSSKLNYARHPFWVIVHKTEGIIIKEIIDHNVKTGDITCHSLNHDKDSYPDFDLHLDDIKELYNIIHIGKDI